MEEKKPFFKTIVFRNVIIALCGIVVALIIFNLGMIVGYHKATFSYHWSEDYHRNFAGPGRGFMGDMVNSVEGKDLHNPHGAFGKIISVELPTFNIQNPGEAEKTIVVSGDTTIRHFQDIVSSTDLKVDDAVVVIGDPNNQGQIQAKLIRLMPTSSVMQPAK